MANRPIKMADATRRAQLSAELQRDRELRQKSYRERALKLFPHVCARCGRQLEGARLRELTVHHKDHDHTNNPNDGSNWELLCLYCHDDEHEKHLKKGFGDGRGEVQTVSTFTPFAGLDALLKPKEKPPDGHANR
jgi:hypothetical protein